MTASDYSHLFNIYIIRDFLDTNLCDQIVFDLSRSDETAAAVYDRDEVGGINEAMRKTRRVSPSAFASALINQRLAEVQGQIEQHFSICLTSVEEPQFLHYRTGDFFVAHQDGNTGLMRSAREQSRKISVSVFLNAPSQGDEEGAFDGGALLFTEWRPDRQRGQYAIAAETGMLVAFPSETTHEVTPVTRGDRYSVVSWYQG
jgi:predicted 2-oxoglutarate/Fe(II)-dependent dioxygenase YbiX